MQCPYRKASASVLAAHEREQLESLNREEKTAARTLSQLKDKHEQMDDRKNKLLEDARIQQEKKDEVCIHIFHVLYNLQSLMLLIFVL